jgi:hypothetical protein
MLTVHASTWLRHAACTAARRGVSSDLHDCSAVDNGDTTAIGWQVLAATHHKLDLSAWHLMSCSCSKLHKRASLFSTVLPCVGCHIRKLGSTNVVVVMVEEAAMLGDSHALAGLHVSGIYCAVLFPLILNKQVFAGANSHRV